MASPQLLHICRPGIESLAVRELNRLNTTVLESFPGAVLSRPAGVSAGEIAALSCFSFVTLEDPMTLSFPSIKQCGAAIADWFCESARAERFTSPWPFLVIDNGEFGSGRSASVQKWVVEGIHSRMSRVAKLAQSDVPGPGVSRGLFVALDSRPQPLKDGHGMLTVRVSRVAAFGGQRRMKDAPNAPSRSYLKIEEAYCAFQLRPAQGQTVVDLGAAPGGWSFSAASCGAFVYAIDNGPLKAGAHNNPMIEHRMEDAFTFGPPHKKAVDWLFCDMVEDPFRIIALVRTWLDSKWCRFFIVNLKFGRTDPIVVLQRVQDKKYGFASFCSRLIVRHLFHDREEFTVMGIVDH